MPCFLLCRKKIRIVMFCQRSYIFLTTEKSSVRNERLRIQVKLSQKATTQSPTCSSLLSGGHAEVASYWLLLPKLWCHASLDFLQPTWVLEEMMQQRRPRRILSGWCLHKTNKNILHQEITNCNKFEAIFPLRMDLQMLNLSILTNTFEIIQYYFYEKHWHESPWKIIFTHL